MQFLLLLLMLTRCAAIPQDLSGKMFTFPQETSTAHVRLNVSQQTISAVTICHRSYTNLKRNHALFSLATPNTANEFLIFWDQNKGIMPHISDEKSYYGGLDYRLNTWHSICTTWDSTSGLVQLWFNGQPLARKFAYSGSSITGTTIIILGQEQDSHGGGFDAKQSFVGMMSDVHMWDYVLSPCEIHSYVDEESFTGGNVLNWKALDFQVTGRVLIEDKIVRCH